MALSVASDRALRSRRRQARNEPVAAEEALLLDDDDDNASAPKRARRQPRGHRTGVAASTRAGTRHARGRRLGAAAVALTGAAAAGGGAGGGAGASADSTTTQLQSGAAATPAARDGGAGAASTSAPQAAPNVSSTGDDVPSDDAVEAMLVKLTSTMIASMKYKPHRRTLTKAHLERAVEVYTAISKAQQAELLKLGPGYLAFMAVPRLQLTSGTRGQLTTSRVLDEPVGKSVKVEEDADGLWLVAMAKLPHRWAFMEVYIGQLYAFAKAVRAGGVFTAGNIWSSSSGHKMRFPVGMVQRQYNPQGAQPGYARGPIVIFELEVTHRSIKDLRKLVDEYFLDPGVEVVVAAKVLQQGAANASCAVVMYLRTAALPGGSATAAGTYAVAAQLDIGPTPLSAEAKRLWASVGDGPLSVSVPQVATAGAPGWVTWTGTLHPDERTHRVTWGDKGGHARPAVGMPEPPATTAPRLAGVSAVDARRAQAAIDFYTSPAAVAAHLTVAHAARHWKTSPTVTIPAARLLFNVAAAGGAPVRPHASFTGLTLDMGAMLNECMLAM